MSFVLAGKSPLPVRRNVVLLLVVLLLALWSTILWSNARSEAQGLSELRRETSALALLFANHADSTFRNIDHALTYLREIWVKRPAEFRHEVELHRRFLAEEAFQTAVADAQGRIVFSTLDLPEQALQAGEHEHVKVHLEGREDRLFVSRPVRGPLSDRWALQLSRPIFDQGQLAGVIYISANPDHFVNFYAATGLGAGGAARMIRDSGEVMARSSEQDKHLGRVILPTPYADPGAPLQGSFRRRAQADGVDRLSSYFRLPQYGVTVIIGPSVDERLAPLRAQQRQMLFIGAAVSAVLLLVVWQLLRNMSRRDAAQAELREQQQRLSVATLHSGIGIWDWDVRTRQLVWDDSMFLLYQLPRGGFDATLEVWRNALHPADRERVLAALDAAVAGGQPYDAEFRIVLPDGRVRHIRAMAKVFRDEQGAALRMVGTNIDVSERKDQEERLRLAASVFTHAREGIAITDAEGAIIEVNETFTQITGHAREDTLGRTLDRFWSGRQGEDFRARLWRELAERSQWSGEVWMRRKTGESYVVMLTVSGVRDERGELQHCVGLFTDITSIKERQRHLEHRANYDALTDLPNRVLLMDRLNQAVTQAQRRAKRMAVVFLDLDGFKQVNDRHGHDVGDELLVALSERMKAALREGDTLSRVGGDEFVAVLPDLDSTTGSVAVLERLLLGAARPVLVRGVAMQVSASLGVAVYPGDAVRAEQLLNLADQAMYAAKQDGGNRYRFHAVSQPEAVPPQA